MCLLLKQTVDAVVASKSAAEVVCPHREASSALRK